MPDPNIGDLIATVENSTSELSSKCEQIRAALELLESTVSSAAATLRDIREAMESRNRGG